MIVFVCFFCLFYVNAVIDFCKIFHKNIIELIEYPKKQFDDGKLLIAMLIYIQNLIYGTEIYPNHLLYKMKF